MFLEKGVLKICSKFTGEHPYRCAISICSKFTVEHPYRSVISIKLACSFIEITLRHGCSPIKLLHIFRTPFSKNTSGRLLLCIRHSSFCNNIKLQLFITGKIIFFILVLLLLWKISYLIIEIICYFTCSVFDLNEMC